MQVLLNRERLESALPDVAAAAMAPMVPANVRREQPLHPPREVAVVSRPQHKMKMVGHEAVAEHTYGQAFARRGKEITKGFIIGVVAKDAGPAIAAVDDVVTDSTDGSTSGSRHEDEAYTTGGPGQQKS